MDINTGWRLYSGPSGRTFHVDGPFHTNEVTYINIYMEVVPTT